VKAATDLAGARPEEAMVMVALEPVKEMRWGARRRRRVRRRMGKVTGISGARTDEAVAGRTGGAGSGRGDGGAGGGG
jgi:hypothetical protein